MIKKKIYTKEIHDNVRCRSMSNDFRSRRFSLGLLMGSGLHVCILTCIFATPSCLRSIKEKVDLCDLSRAIAPNPIFIFYFIMNYGKYFLTYCYTWMTFLSFYIVLFFIIYIQLLSTWYIYFLILTFH